MGSAVRRKSVPIKRDRKGASLRLMEKQDQRSWWNEGLALVYSTTALLLALALISQRLSLGSAGHTAASNLMGPAGHFLATMLYGFLGWAAALPVAGLAVLGYRRWNLDRVPATEHTRASRVMRGGGAVMALLFGSALFVVVGSASGGGRLGASLGLPLRRFFGAGGAVLICAALLFLGIALASDQSLPALARRAARFSALFLKTIFIVVPYALVNISWHLSALAVRSFSRLLRYATGMTDPRDREKAEQPLPKPRRRKNTLATQPSELDSAVPTVDRDVGTAAKDDDYSHVVVSRRGAAVVKKGRADTKLPDRGGDPDQPPEFVGYKAPELDLLTRGELNTHAENDEELLQTSRQIETKLRDFGIEGRVTEVHPGPVITLYEFEPAPGIKVGKIASLQDDLAMSLKATSIRILAPIPKRGTVGIEVPNRHRDIVRLRDVLESEAFVSAESTLSVAIGKDTYGDPVVVDISLMPHLLMAGATGTGKSVCINTLLLSLLYRATPAELGLIMIDPKVLELSVYEGIPHLRVPVVTVAKQAKAVLDWAAREMERRYRLMQKFGVRNIDSYNKVVKGEADEENNRPGQPPLTVTKEEIILGIPAAADLGTAADGTASDDSADGTSGAADSLNFTEQLKPLPKIVIVIDELADLMLTVGRDIEELITRLAQKARAAGIHLIVATQRPSVDVITGLIKANFPARLSFRVTSRIDSRTILDSMGAEKLLGRGDMLFMQPGAGHLKRVHGAFVSDAEVKKVIESIKAHCAPQYDQRIMQICEKALQEDRDGSDSDGDSAGDYDEFYDKAVELVVAKGQASTSMIQRAFRIGYNRAARIIDMMEREGVIGPMDGVKPRDVLVPPVEGQ